MSKTLSELRTEVYAQLAETSGFYSNSEITQWLNDGVEDICLDIEPLARNATVNIVADTHEYALPCDIINVRFAMYGGTGEWVKLSECKYEDLFDNNSDWEDTTNLSNESVPSMFYWRGNIVGLYPIPGAALTAGLRIYYTYIPTEMSDDADETGLDFWLDKAVVKYAVYKCRLKDRDEQRAQYCLREYKALVNQAGKKLNKHRKNHAPRLVSDQTNYRIYYQRMPTYTRVYSNV